MLWLSSRRDFQALLSGHASLLSPGPCGGPGNGRRGVLVDACEGDLSELGELSNAGRPGGLGLSDVQKFFSFG